MVFIIDYFEENIIKFVNNNKYNESQNQNMYEGMIMQWSRKVFQLQLLNHLFLYVLQFLQIMI